VNGVKSAKVVWKSGIAVVCRDKAELKDALEALKKD